MCIAWIVDNVDKEDTKRRKDDNHRISGSFPLIHKMWIDCWQLIYLSTFYNKTEIKGRKFCGILIHEVCVNGIILGKWGLTAVTSLTIINLLWCKFIYCQWRQRRCLAWNRHISRIHCGERELTASAKEWRQKAAAWFWKNAAWKAERNFLLNYYEINRKVPVGGIFLFFWHF